MRLFFHLICSVACGAVLAEPSDLKVIEPPPQQQGRGDAEVVISSSEQFVVAGGDPQNRAAAAWIAEEARNEFFALVKFDEENAPHRIHMDLHGRPTDPLPLRSHKITLLDTDAGFSVFIGVHLSRGLDPAALKETATAAMIYERGLRTRSRGDAERPMQVPPWLIQGLREASDWRLKQSDRKLYAAIFNHGGWYKMNEMLALNEVDHQKLDGASKWVFRISAGAFVMALLEQPDGLEGFRALLDEIAGFEGEMPVLLQKHFPELNLSQNSMAKWWMLQMANLGALNLLTDVMTIAQTETALTEALQLSLTADDGTRMSKPLSDWQEIISLPEQERAAAVKPTEESLARLGYRCFPSYRTIIAEYQIVLTSLLKAEPKDIAQQLAALDTRRSTMLAKATRARDYLDFFEISRARETSGVFDDYLRLKERMKINPRRRADHISNYLDAMDEIFSRENLTTSTP